MLMNARDRVARRAAIVALTAVVVVAGGVGGLLLGDALGRDTYSVSLGAGVTPRMNPDAVAGSVRATFDAMHQGSDAVEATAVDIVSLQAVELKDLPRLVPGIADVGGDIDLTRVVWVVEARGPYVFDFGNPNQARVRTGTTGWLVIGDADGTAIAVQTAD